MMTMPTSVETQTEDKGQLTGATATTTMLTQTETTGQKRGVLPAISTEFIQRSDDMTRFYTGLSKWELVIQWFSLLSPYITPSRTRLTLQDELILVLVKLRLNIPFQDLAYQWIVSISTVTRIFHKWINVMSEHMKFLIKWPSREIFHPNLPRVFRDTYPNSVCIIDCSEIFIERPTRCEARAKTYSQYKKNEKH